jgi:signal transduction histidine kinase/ligand-binding sensor domain-containing protein
MSFAHLSLEQGLSQSSAYAIVQDHQGFIWIGTQDGLDRYDGYTFTVFRHDPKDTTSISHNYVLRLFVDSKGNIWAGTSGGGLNCYNPQSNRFTRYIHMPNDPGSLSDNTVFRIYEDHRGVIWVATLNGLNRLDERKGVFTHFFSDSQNVHTLNSNLVSTMYEDHRGRFWVSGNRGVALNHPDGTFSRIRGMTDLINSIFEDNDGSLWFVGEGAFRYDSLQNRLVKWFSWGGGSEHALYNGDGTVWIGTFGGLELTDLKRKKMSGYRHDPIDPASLSENSVLAICKDRSGIVWVGTYGGVNKFVPGAKKFDLFTYEPKNPNSLSSPRVRGFSQDRTGAVWIATQEGMNRFDRRTGDFIRYYGPPKDRIALNGTLFWSVLVDRFSPVLSVWGGLNGPAVDELSFPPGRDLKNPLVRNFPSPREISSGVVTSLLQDRSGTIWIGHFDGAISVYDRSRHAISQLKSPDGRSINVIYEDRKGAIWSGGYTCGLHLLNRGENAFEPFFHNTGVEKSVAENSTLSMTEDTEGTLWVGTYEGLLRIRDGKLLERITDKDGLPNNVIYGVLPDNKGNLWFSSNKGITRFNIATRQLTNFDVDDGAQSSEFNQGASFRADNGEMYFGGINGFNVFHPDSIKDNPNIPAVVLTDFKVFNESLTPSASERRLKRNIPLEKELDLDYSDNVLTFDFAALEYTNPANNLYAYKMVGFDKDWASIGSKREATYTNLDPGRYTFRVKASNNDGVWNEEGASIEVVVAPPWWMTWWFRGMVILAFLSIGTTVYYRRVAVLKSKYAQQQDFSRRLIETQERERKRIASELHDSIGQDLLVIKNRTYMANQVKPLNPKAREQLDHITKAVTQSLQNVRQISRNLRPYHLDRVGLTGAIRSMLETIAQSSPIVFDIQLDAIDGLFTAQGKEMEVNLYRIVQESVNNVLKHSEAKHAAIHIEKSDAGVTLHISDDGKGFEPKKVHAPESKAGLGLSGIGERVGMLGGTYIIESSAGAGTTVTVFIPLSTKPT